MNPSEERAAAVKLAHDLGLHTWDGGDDQGYGGEYEVNEKAVKKIELALATAREEERRADCAAVCVRCRDGELVQEMNYVQTANGRPFWHVHNRAWSVCPAAAIHERSKRP